MIKELNDNVTPNWGETIRLEMDLEDLQIIYDCVGAVPLKYWKNKHKNTIFKNEINIYCPNMITELYEEIEYIIDKHNGVTDNDINVNLDCELIMSTECEQGEAYE